MRTCLNQCLLICLFAGLIQSPLKHPDQRLFAASASMPAKKDGSQLHFPAILFPKNSDQMDARSNDSVNAVMEILLDNPTVVISLSGHCSSDERSPDDLSFSRAVTIRNYLIKKGFDSDRIVTKGMGTSNPFISDSRINAVSTARQKEYLMGQNRRVVAAVIGTDDGRRK